MITKLTTCIVALTAGLAGCAAPPAGPSAQFAPVFPVEHVKENQYSGSIFEDGSSETLFGRKRDYRVGDQIMVVLDESAQATRVQGSKTSRAATNDAIPSVQAGIGRALGGYGFPGMSALSSAATQIKPDGNTITSEGTGNAGQLQTLKGNIAVTVVEVFANGNLYVRGEKRLELSEGAEVIQVSGMVRVQDIAPNGTVMSNRLANSQIAYRGYGDGAAAAQAGWGTRFLYRFWPF